MKTTRTITVYVHTCIHKTSIVTVSPTVEQVGDDGTVVRKKREK